MPAMKFINKILRINTLVKLRATGSPHELAGKLGISERSVYEYINDMKELGAPIAFSYSHNSYIYYEDGELLIGFSDELLKEEDETITFGGCAEWTIQVSNDKIFCGDQRFNLTAAIMQ
jgi:predicted DNA-binding transcriptional regulator YafY